MLLDGHDLDGIVAVGNDARQYVHTEFLIGTHTLAVLRHADVALVDEQRARVGHKVLDLELVGLFGCPHLGREDVGLLVLNHARGIGRDALAFSALPVHAQLVQVAVVHGALGQNDFPIAVVQPFQLVGGTLAPVIELADQINLSRIGGPFTEHPVAVGRAVQAIVVVGVGKLDQIARTARELGYLVHSILMPPVDGVAVRLQPRVIVDNRKILFLPHFRSVLIK